MHISIVNLKSTWIQLDLAWYSVTDVVLKLGPGEVMLGGAVVSRLMCLFLARPPSWLRRPVITLLLTILSRTRCKLSPIITGRSPPLFTLPTPLFQLAF